MSYAGLSTPMEMALGATSNVYDSEDATGTISPLLPVLIHGLGAVATFGFASFLTSLILFAYLTYKLVSWQLNPPDRDSASSQKRATSPEPESPTLSDANGFLAPPSHFCPQKDEDEAATLPQRALDTFWQRLRKEPPNQFLVLIYNLLFADIQQATAFLLNANWLVKNSVAVGSPVCWAQGWFVSTGDLASSVFITAIAMHTYLGVVQGYRLSTWAFYSAICALWGFVYGMALLGVIVTNNGSGQGGLYVRAGAWCWINSAFQDLRLYLHYLWIFLALALTSIIYLVIFLHLHMHRRHSDKCCLAAGSHGEHYPNPDPNGPELMVPGSPRSTTTNASSSSSSAAKRLPPIPRSARHPTFLLYPLIYVLCTAPLAAGRIASMAGNDVSLAYFCFAGSMIASAGWLDVALYASTRRSIVFSGQAPPSQDTGLETFAFMRTPAGRRFGNVVVVSGGDGSPNKCHEGKRWRRWNDQVIAGARLRSLRGGGDKNSSQPSLKGFGSGAGEIMGMAIQCDTVTSVTVEIDETKSDTASLCSQKGSIASDMAKLKS